VDGVVRVVAGLAGAALVVGTLLSAVITLVLPRGVQGRMFRLSIVGVRAAVDAATRRTSRDRRDMALALVAPMALLLLPVLWIVIVWVGYAGAYVAAGVDGAWSALRLSGSSLLTLGFVSPDGVGQTLLAFSEATIGLGLLTLLIAYLPTMYSAFSAREIEVAMLEVRAGDPPSAVEMLGRYRRIGRDDQLPELFDQWEGWFAVLDETHTSLAALPLFRSTSADRSWVTAAGTVLDAASLYLACVDQPPRPAANLCIRGGYTTLRRICDLYGIPYDADPAPDDPIALSRDEFDQAYARLGEAGYPLREDRDQAWRDFAGWRVNYDGPLLSLAVVLDVPYAPWTADRSPLRGRPTLGRPAGRRRRAGDG
jgi:hypothetical protein